MKPVSVKPPSSFFSDKFYPTVFDLLWGGTFIASELSQLKSVADLSQSEALERMLTKVGAFALSMFAGYQRSKSSFRSYFETSISQSLSGYLNMTQIFESSDFVSILFRDLLNGFCLGELSHRALNGDKTTSSPSATSTASFWGSNQTSTTQNSGSSKTIKKLSKEELKKKLDEQIIGQESAKQKIVQAIQLHQLTEGSSTPKPARILLVGPTGSGKSATVKALAEALNRPYVCVDSPSLTPEGFVGASFSETWSKLIEAAGNNIANAERGIVFIDEADKLFDRTTSGSMGQRVQQQLLKALEGTTVSAGASLFSNRTLHTHNMIFILGGVFENLPKMDDETEITTDQLDSFGVSRELLGRLSEVAQLEVLGKQELLEILRSKTSSASLAKWQDLFLNLKCHLTIEEEVLEAIVDFALKKGTGARGLESAMRQLLNPHLEKVQQRYQELIARLPPNRINLISPTELQIGVADWLTTNMAKQSEFERAHISLGDVKEALESEVVGQEEAKNVVSQAVYLQQLNIAEDLGMPKGNILMIGPSGSGKTFMMEVLSQKLNIPLAIMDASKITRQGIVGPKPEDVLVRLLESCHGDIRAAEKGIVVLDEMDKIFDDARSNMMGSSSEVTGRAVLNQLLRMLQGDQVNVKYKGQDVTINTTNIQFVLAGAFTRSPHLYQKKELEEEDFLRAGLTPEFLGRIGYKTRLSPIGENEFRQYLLGANKKALLNQWRETFQRVGAVLLVEESAINRWIEKCLNNQTGIRGLQNLVRAELSEKLVEATQRRNSEEGPLLITVV